VRFYKSTTNTGTHVGNLWDTSGHLLATATFSNESASGWQQVLFGAPVAVAANTTYVVSYHTNSGHYGYDIDYFIQHGVDNGVLHALSGPATGGNGVYVYGPTGFPSNSYRNANYWVDVLFNGTGTTTGVTASVNPAAVGQAVTFTATVSAVGTPTGTVTFKDGATTLGTGTLNASGRATFTTTALAAGSHAITAVYGGDATFGGSTSAPVTVTVFASASTTTTALAASGTALVGGQAVTFTATVSADGTPTGTVTFKDGTTTLGTGTLNASGQATFTTAALAVGGHAILAVYGGDATFSGSTSAPVPVAVLATIWSNTATPSVIQTDSDAVELGLRFRSDVAGTVLGVRFYKGTTNTGTHIGNLWDSSGNLLATATFTNESASGWQQVLFGAPVTIAANTTYVVSYHTDVGHYGFDANYFANGGVDSGVLHALSNAAAGGNGVYVYGPTGFPSTVNGLAVNYWVDVLFNGSGTTASVATSVNPSVFGQTVTFTATVTSGSGSGTPTGTVTFLDGTTTLGTATLNAQGQAVFTTALLGVGSHGITALYSGDPTFTTSTSAAVSQTVNRAATAAAVASSLSPARVGQAVTFTATVTAAAPGSGTPTGTVTFMDGSTVIGTATLNAQGQATLTISTLAAGSHAITASYGGDANFNLVLSPIFTELVNP
jgi:hypothetical protein